jgi:hypothetical protein
MLSDELNNLHSSPNLMKKIKPKEDEMGGAFSEHE